MGVNVYMITCSQVLLAWFTVSQLRSLYVKWRRPWVMYTYQVPVPILYKQHWLSPHPIPCSDTKGLAYSWKGHIRLCLFYLPLHAWAYTCTCMLVNFGWRPSKTLDSDSIWQGALKEEDSQSQLGMQEIPRSEVSVPAWWLWQDWMRCVQMSHSHQWLALYNYIDYIYTCKICIQCRLQMAA